MPATLCHCGERVNYGSIPNPTEWLLVSDVAFDALTDPETDKVAAEDLFHQMKHALLCPHCGRLWVFWNGFAADPHPPHAPEALKT